MDSLINVDKDDTQSSRSFATSASHLLMTVVLSGLVFADGKVGDIRFVACLFALLSGIWVQICSHACSSSVAFQQHVTSP